MAKNATAEQVAVVLAAVAEEFLIDVPSTWDRHNVSFIEFTTLANAFVNSPKEWYANIAEYINTKE